MQHLIVIGSVWPEPNSSAAGTRILQLMDLFQSASWKVTYASAALPSEHRVDLSARGVIETRIELNCSSFDTWIAGLQPTAVLFDRFMSEEQFGWRVAQACPNALRLLDTEDLHSLRATRWQSLKQRQAEASSEAERQSAGPVLDGRDPLYEAMASSDLAQREIASIYRSDLSLMISDFEMALLKEQFKVPDALLHYLPLFASPAAGPTPDYSEREHFVSLGNFRHPPNWDAVLWLKHQLWPALRAKLPKAELHLYGAYPPPKATALTQAKQGFWVKGWAPSAHEVMARGRVCLAPLRFGAGVKGKLLDAMACRTPSVTTSIGAEAMVGAQPWPGAIADNAESFVEAAAGLYEQQAQWELAQSRCVPLLEQRFEASAFSHYFIERIETLQSGMAAHRQANFIGAMLNHHQHRSTQYMSQWIEVKTRLKSMSN